MVKTVQNLFATLLVLSFAFAFGVAQEQSSENVKTMDGTNDRYIDHVAHPDVTNSLNGEGRLVIPPQRARSLMSILSGTYTVGSGGNFTTLKQAIDTLNANMVGAPGVTFSLTDPSYTDSLLSINPITYATTPQPVVMKPAAGISPVLNLKPNATVPAGLRLIGVQYFTMDGSNSGGSSRDMTINLTDTTGATQYSALLIRDTTNNSTFKNMIVKGNRPAAAATVLGVVRLDTVVGQVGFGRSIVLDNLHVSRGIAGIVVAGGALTTGRAYQDLEIKNCFIGAGTVVAQGVGIAGNIRTLFHDNEINGVATGAFPFNCFALNFSGHNQYCQVYNNKIHNITYSGAATGVSIAAQFVGSILGGFQSRFKVWNNMVWDIDAPTSTNTGSGGGPKQGLAFPSCIEDSVYYNSVWIDSASTANNHSAAYYIVPAAGTSNTVAYNNVFVNTSSMGTTAFNPVVKFFDGSGATYASADLNDYFYTGARGAIAATGPLSLTPTFQLTLPDFQAVSGQDANSFSDDPRFDVTNLLHINSLVPTVVEGNATPISGIGTDIDGNLRSGSTPDLGADEGTFIPLVFVKEIQVLSVSLSPVTPNVGSPITVSATIKNNGVEANPASVPLTYKVGTAPSSSGDGTAQTFSPSWTGNTAVVSFTTTYSPGVAGSLTMCVRSFYAGDLLPDNDSSKTSVTVLTPGTWLNEKFTLTGFPPPGWSVGADMVGSAWGKINAVQPDGVTGPSGKLDFYGRDSLALDTLTTPVLDLSALASVAASKFLSFDHAYQSYPPGYPDSVKIIVSSNGGATWTSTLYQDGYPNMVTVSPATGTAAFVPSSSSQWKHNTILVPAGVLTGSFRMAIVGKSAFGNNFWIDNIQIKTLPDTDFVVQSVAQLNGIPSPFSIIQMNGTPNKKSMIGETITLMPGTRRSDVNNSIMLPSSPDNSGGGNELASLGSITINTSIQNVGLTARPFTIDWSVGSASMPSVARPSLGSLAVDATSLAGIPLQRGTLTSTVSVSMTSDDDPSDNTKSILRTYVYPNPMVRIHYDNNALNSPENFVGFGAGLGDVEAGVRFTASQNMKLSNVDAYYRNEVSLDSITVKVYAAGVNDSTPGSLLYSQKFGGPNYNSPGGAGTGSGDYFTLPLGSNAPMFASGSNFWVSILFSPGIQFPMGIHNTAFTAGHSFLSADSGATWSRLVITTERAWLLRVVGAPANVSLAGGWNLISNPVTTANDSVKQLYPAATFPYAFRFAGAGGYQQDYTMDNGVGYWEKFPGAAVNGFVGTPRTSDSIAVSAGWNIVGSVSGNVDTSTITSTPPGLRSSTSWFGYAAGYTGAPAIEEGKGYWVKANAVGKFYFSSGVTPPRPAQQVIANPLDALNTVTISDGRGGLQTLYFGADVNNKIPASSYELPPAPPAGAFDARFSAADGGYMVRTHPARVENVIDLPVDVQSVAYPLTVSWKIASGSYTLSDAMGGQAFSPRSMTGEGSAQISSSKFTIKVVGGSGVPTEFALSQNYPNPFNPTTNIRFALPVQSRVTIDIYNVLGQKVRTLLKEDRQAGYHAAEWNGTGNAGQQLGSGVYFLQLSATGANGKSFNDIRKLMLLK